MYFDLTNHENMIAALALVLIVIFCLAALLDNCWRMAKSFREFGSDLKSNSVLEGADKDRVSHLYTRYAALSAGGRGTALEQTTFRGETRQNLEGD